jgi:hypothetical protein
VYHEGHVAAPGLGTVDGVDFSAALGDAHHGRKERGARKIVNFSSIAAARRKLTKV